MSVQSGTYVSSLVPLETAVAPSDAELSWGNARRIGRRKNRGIG